MKITLFHYTDENGKNGIEEHEKISSSSKGKFGKGVYFTSLPPYTERIEIASNNWDGTTGASFTQLEQNVFQQGKVDYYVKIEISQKNRFLCNFSGVDGRDIYLYSRDMDLTKFPHEFGRVRNYPRWQIVLYHYIDEDDLDEILEDEKIYPSNGDSVYLTSLPPDSQEVKSAVNYPGSLSELEQSVFNYGRIDNFIKITISRKNRFLHIVDEDFYVYENTMNLEQLPYEEGYY